MHYVLRRCRRKRFESFFPLCPFSLVRQILAAPSDRYFTKRVMRTEREVLRGVSLFPLCPSSLLNKRLQRPWIGILQREQREREERGNSAPSLRLQHNLPKLLTILKPLDHLDTFRERSDRIDRNSDLVLENELHRFREV
jgi:hypothetical protein